MKFQIPATVTLPLLDVYGKVVTEVTVLPRPAEEKVEVKVTDALNITLKDFDERVEAELAKMLAVPRVLLDPERRK